MADIKFEIKETIGVLSESAKGWTKELSLVSWNDKEPKYDIREWSPDHSKMGKGVTAWQRSSGVVEESTGWTESLKPTLSDVMV